MYAYDDQDRLTGETWTSGGSAPPPPPCSNTVQNLPLGNLSAFAGPSCATPGAGSLVYAALWEYDGSGNRTRQVENGVESLYAHDAQNRLTSETRTGVSIAYTYDRNGNQATRTENGVLEQLSFDYMNRIRTYQKSGTSFFYRYMPTGERVAKTDLLASTEQWFMYDGQDVTTDYARSGGGPLTPERSYVNGRAIDAAIGRIEASGALYFYGGDAIGSVHEMIDTAGAIVRQSLYTAWGRDLPGFSGVSFSDRYAFTHRERDDESSLMHYRARSYDPRTGLFLQREPRLGERVSRNYGAFALNPMLLSDPSGATITVAGSVAPGDKQRIEKYVQELQFWSVRLDALATIARDPVDKSTLGSFAWIPDLIYYVKTTNDVDIEIETARFLPGAWGRTEGLDGGPLVESIREIGRAQVTLLDEGALKSQVKSANDRLALQGRKRVLTEDEVGKEVLVHELLHVLLATRIAHGRMTEDMAKESFHRIFGAVEKLRVVQVPRAIGGARAKRLQFTLTERSFEETGGFEYFVGSVMTSRLHLDLEEQEGELGRSSFTNAWRRLAGGR